MRLTENQLKSIIRESIITSLNEISDRKIGWALVASDWCANNPIGKIVSKKKGNYDKRKRQYDAFSKNAEGRDPEELRQGKLDFESGEDQEEKLRKSVSESKLQNKINRLIRESIWEDTEDDDDDKTKKKKKNNDDESIEKKREEVMDWLLDSEDEEVGSYSLNHADIMRQLWHPESDEEEDSLRSLFAKKLHHTENDNGSIYDFSDEEINDLFNIKGNI